jgi:hypothetical protein
MERASIAILVFVVAASPNCGSESAPGPEMTDSATDKPVGTASPTDVPPSPTPATDDQPPDVEPPAPTGFPCDVHAVVQANCASCHAGHLYYGPNFDSRDDLFRPAADLFSVASHPVAPGTFGEHMAVALGDWTMPQYGAPSRPSAAEREFVIGWIAAGMPGGDCGGLSSAP